ncbi:DUF3488 and transglutaminase-like domain-containing protein, partial [Streptomyces sp. B1866]|uniref:transglutaminase TgpA family protein n=1 Tax=Streptomyces sp. B1866 TaxID=3075431 RepID=UPI00288CC023
MRGRVGLAVCAAVATLASACALLPLVDQHGWLPQAALLLGVQSAVGVLARRLVPARPLAVAAQALTGLLLLTAVFAHGQAAGGVLPGPPVFDRFAQLLRAGGDDVGEYTIPAPATDGIRLMLVGGVLLVGLMVDTLAVTYRAAAPAGLPLLALYSVAAALSGGGSAEWLGFLVAAAGYLLLLLAESRGRLTQWGRVFTAGGPHAPPPAGPGAAGGGRLRAGHRIGALALGIALAVPAVLPSLGSGLLGERDGGAGGGGGISAVDSMVALQNSLNQPENREVLRYRSSTQSTQDLYLRFIALDEFDGAEWRAAPRPVTDLPGVLPDPPGLAPDVDASPVRSYVQVARWYGQSEVPLPYPASEVNIGGRWAFEPEARMLVGQDGQTTQGVRYAVSSLQVRPTAAQLAAAPAPPAGLLRRYTRVPDSLPDVVARTARQVTARQTTLYEKAVRLQDWFAVDGGFRYDTRVKSGSGTKAIARFLKQKEGFCVHFAFSMAAMARTLGIPARVAVGFQPGTAQTDGSVSVGIRDAHAWPELYFQGVGWTRFEPTPSRGVQPDYTLVQPPAGEASDAPTPQSSASPRASASPSPSASCPADGQQADGCATAPPPVADGGSSGGGWPLPSSVGWGALALVLAVVPMLPMLWRIRARSRRLRGPGAHAGAPPDAAGRTLAAWREMVDTAWDHGVVPDDSLTPRGAVARIVRTAGLDEPAARAAHRVATAVEQVLYAPRPHPTTGLTDDVLRVAAGLRAATGRWTRLRALVAPRSAVRAAWAAEERWSALARRWSDGRWAAALRRP